MASTKRVSLGPLALPLVRSYELYTKRVRSYWIRKSGLWIVLFPLAAVLGSYLLADMGYTVWPGAGYFVYLLYSWNQAQKRNKVRILRFDQQGTHLSFDLLYGEKSMHVSGPHTDFDFEAGVRGGTYLDITYKGRHIGSVYADEVLTKDEVLQIALRCFQEESLSFSYSGYQRTAPADMSAFTKNLGT